ncbi:hypothetical protein EBR96_03940 [bacterium]|nr:hypothetical protein [bacterium]
MRAQICSFGYTTFRSWVIQNTYKNQLKEGRPIDLEEVVELGDRYIKWVQFFLSPFVFSFRIPKSISVQLYDLYFPSPLTISSFKDDLQILYFWMNFGMGGAVLKTVMSEPREGNPRPRLQEVTLPGMKGLLNAMGLPGKGVEKTIQQLRKASLLRYNRPIGVSIGGSSINEYKQVADQFVSFFRSVNHPHYYEINISCPNTPDGQDMLKNPTLLDELLRHIRSQTDAMISVKFSPDQDNHQLLVMGELVAGHSKTAINVGNTSFRTCEQLGLATNAISLGGGGYSGEAQFPRTLEMVKLLSGIGVPLIATGGVSTTAQVEALLDHGASLIGMATALVQNPYCVPIINQRLASQSKRLLF